jgi:predicted transposase YbfD/YdcC
MTTPCVKLDADAFLNHFGALKDPRQVGKIDHLLVDVLVIALLATICGAETWSQIQAFGKRKRALLAELLPLPHGIPSKHTFQRVFAHLDPRAFEAAFRGWIGDLVEHTAGRLIALDGKTVRGSGKGLPRGRALHLVHAWAVGNRLLLGQLAADKKSNEITALPELLKLLDLKGAVVTIDAAGTHKPIAAQIVDADADYILAVKKNQPKLYAAVTGLLAPATTGAPLATASTAENGSCGHGRIELRRVWAMDATDLPMAGEWKGLASAILVESERRIDGVLTREHRYYMSSLPPDDATRLGRRIRGHWGVENTLHWSLDVAFHEDDCLVYAGNSPENLALLRKIALTVLHRDTTATASLAERRKEAGWDDAYLLEILRRGITE